MWNIDREHPEYTVNAAMWSKYRDLYVGGEQIRRNASAYLYRRNKEPNEVFTERLAQVFYENYIGSIIDWYAATLMRREPVITYDGKEAGKTYFNLLTEDCDLKGTNLYEFFRQQFVRALVWGKTHIAVEFPKGAQNAKTRAEEDALGLSRAYLVDYSPEELINWSRDDEGNLLWAVVRTRSLRQAKISAKSKTCLQY
jgi:hypothetical protein